MSLSKNEDQRNEASYPTSAEENQSPRVKGLCSQTILLQELLLALSSRANVLIAAINLDYQFTYFNQAYVDEVERLVGIKLQIGMTVMDVYRDSPEQLAIAIKQWGRSLGGEPFIDVVKFLRSETSENFYEVTNSPMKNAQGIITGAVLVARNITDRLGGEHLLTESEMRYQHLFDYIIDGLAICEFLFDDRGQLTDYRILDVNPNFTHMIGYLREQIIGSAYSDLTPSLSLLGLNQLNQLALTGETLHFEEYSPTLERYYEVYAYSLPKKYFAIILSDITKRKEEEANKEWLGSFPELNPMPVLEIDYDGKITYQNPAARKIFIDLNKTGQSHPLLAGISEVMDKFKAGEELKLSTNVPIGNSWLQLNIFQHRQLERLRIYSADITASVIAKQELHELNRKLEETVTLRTKELNLLNEELKKDISRRKKSEEALVAERKRFIDVLEVLPAYVSLLTPDGHISFANKFYRDRFGDSSDFLRIKVPKNRDRLGEIYETFKPLVNGRPNEWEWKGPDNRIYRVYDYLFTDVDGAKLILEMGLDITEIRKTKEILQETSNYNRSLIEANPDFLVTITRDGVIEDVNAAAEEATGFNREELIGTRFDSYFDNPEKASQGLQLVLETGSVRNYELNIVHKDDHSTPVAFNATFYRDLEGNIPGVFASARDLTELKHKENQLIELNMALEEAIAHELAIHDQLVQEEKFAAMGRMLAAVTHEINNPLQTITNCLYLISSDIPEDAQAHQFLAMATSETERISKLVAELKELFRPRQENLLVPLSLPALLDDIHTLIKPQLADQHVEWVLVYESETRDGSWMVEGVVDEMKQVFINLCMNALDAMQPDGGHLQVKLVRNKDNEVGVCITDTGSGIKPENLGRIFDPFFSTKTKGVGLGLSICYDIIQRHNGHIDVTSILGRGSTFEVWLPGFEVKQHQE